VAGQRRERAVDVLPCSVRADGQRMDMLPSPRAPTLGTPHVLDIARRWYRRGHRAGYRPRLGVLRSTDAGVIRPLGQPPDGPRARSPPQWTTQGFLPRSKAGHDVHCHTSCPPKSLLAHGARGPGPCYSRRATEPICTDATPRPRPRAARGRAAGPARRAGRRGGAPSSVVAGRHGRPAPLPGAVPGAGGSRATNRHLRHWRPPRSLTSVPICDTCRRSASLAWVR
jgi:hypothetical protein